MPHGIGLPADGVPNQGWKLYITSLVMVIAAGLTVVGRCATRIQTHQWGPDDYVIVCSLVSIYRPPVKRDLSNQQWAGFLDRSLGRNSARGIQRLWHAQSRPATARASHGSEVVLCSPNALQSRCWLE